MHAVSLRLAGLGLSALMLLGGAPLVHAATTPALQSMPSVDLSRYQGRWYQVAFYPNTFQKQCASNTTADYKPLANGEIEVTNQCRTPTGELSSAVGRARVKQTKVFGIPVGTSTTAKLEVRFAPGWLSWLPGVWADYWVIQLPSDYRYAVVGEPTRKYLWILSRTPQLAPQDRASINAMLTLQGYDPARLQDEPQP